VRRRRGERLLTRETVDDDADERPDDKTEDTGDGLYRR
jgi:hypothetical protein